MALHLRGRLRPPFFALAKREKGSLQKGCIQPRFVV